MHNLCEFISMCPIFKKFKTEAVGQIWLGLYCHKDSGANCARKKLRNEGNGSAKVPATLLPNDIHLADLEDFSGRWEQPNAETCEHLESCMPMFEGLQDPDSRDFWAHRYCFLDQGCKCERRKIMQQGVPKADLSPRLLPNGDQL